MKLKDTIKEVFEMSATNDGGPAFPQDLQGRRGDDPSPQGVSLRDHFAGLAMQATIQSLTEFDLAMAIRDEAEEQEVDSKDIIADMAYRYADAMLTARERNEKP